MPLDGKSFDLDVFGFPKLQTGGPSQIEAFSIQGHGPRMSKASNSRSWGPRLLSSDWDSLQALTSIGTTCVHMSLFAGHTCVRPFLHARVPACRAGVCVRNPLLISIRKGKTLVIFSELFSSPCQSGAVRFHPSPFFPSFSLLLIVLLLLLPSHSDCAPLLPPQLSPIRTTRSVPYLYSLLVLPSAPIPPQRSYDKDPYHSLTSIALGWLIMPLPPSAHILPGLLPSPYIYCLLMLPPASPSTSWLLSSDWDPFQALTSIATTCVHMSLFAGHMCVRPFLHARVPACRACVCQEAPPHQY
jgi:hypothetical protein